MPLIILVADDNLGTRLSLSDYLEMSGYLVISAEDGQQALSMIETYHPHVLVTDINMPRMDGYDLVRQVRQKPAFRWLPVIFLTERTSTEERIKGYQTGCDLYLPKPFEMQELGAVIRSLVERPPWPDRLRSFDRDTLASSVQTKNLALTQREQQVLDLLTTPLSNVEIGNKLHLSPRTVEKYVSSLLRKTGTSNRSELLRFALENHLVD